MWTLRGYDAFEGEYYSLEGEFRTESAAIAAARARIIDLKRRNPNAGGLLDWVFVVSPTGGINRVHG